MKADKKTLNTVLASSLVISMLALAGCGKTEDSKVADTATTTPATPPAPAAPAYTPPTAEQLTQMVAPIALFPDKLLAQVLAGAQYPDQITAANQWLNQNPALKGNALQDAANTQPWDVSVKSLTAFPAVLSQMANNIQWTTALGVAYANAPNDVMNAVQTMRLRAQQSGNLKSNAQMKVSASPRLAPPPEYANDARYYSVPPPAQTIVIESAQPNVVYVPNYNPGLVYGAPVPVYPSYVYHPGYSSGDLIAGGIISFGVGIIVGSALTHHGDWGWHSWGMNWGGHGYGPNYGPDNGWARPAVTYNNTVYAPRSSITINRNYDTHITTNNFSSPNRPALNGNENGNGNRPNFGNPGPNAANANQYRSAQNGPMTMPHFSAADQHAGARPAAPSGGAAPQFHAQQPAVAQERQSHNAERNRDLRPRSETGERLNSTGIQEPSSRHSMANPGGAPTSLRSADVQRSGINQRPEQDRAARENFRQQQFHPETRPDRPAMAQPQPRPQASPQVQHAAPQQQHMQMPQRQEPHVQAPRPEQHVQQRAQQERPQQHAQEHPRPAPRQEEHRER